MKRTTQHATLFDVAREARVGTSTVSRVINGGARVSPDTLERVRAVIRKLGYHPNKAAQILKGERTKTIGLVVPNVANPFFAICVEAAQEILRSHGFLLIVTCSNDDPRIELEDFNTLVQRQVEGILLVPAATSNKELVQVLSRTSIPVVSFDRPIHDSSVPSVVSTNYKGSKEATRHLISHGCKQIVCLAMKGDESLYTSKERIRGYRIAMQEAHLMPKIDFSCTSQESTELALNAHLYGANPPDAIFAIRNLVTIYAFEALHKLQVRVPEKIALVGFDDFQLASILEPPITVVKQEIELMGKMAAELLFDRLTLKRQSAARATDKVDNSGVLWLETELIIRNSCGCHKGEHKN
jgi:LacI family transcriptional regulator